MMDQTITLEQLASLIRGLPTPLVHLRIDEMIAHHIYYHITKEMGIEIDKEEFMKLCLSEDSFREHLTKSYAHNYEKNLGLGNLGRAVKYPCPRCKTQFITPAHLEAHQLKDECKHIIPQVKQGRHILDLNKLA